MSFETQEGSDEQKTIPLDVEINGVNLSGNGLAQASVDPQRGLLFLSSRQLPYISVLSIFATTVQKNFRIETT